MIVKNEAAWITRCLDAVRPIVAEMIVLDTGSSDDTAALAAAAGARVVPYVWADDFAAARNASLAEATGDWILVLDADELLDAHGGAVITKWIAAPTADMAELLQTNYSTESQLAMWRPNDLTMPEAAGQPGYFDVPLVRLFRNMPEIRFIHPIHEVIPPTLRPCVQLPVRLHHYGQVRSEGRARKREQYYQLVAKKYAATPDDPQCVLELAIATYEALRWPEAKPLFYRAIDLIPTFVPSYVALAHICCAQGAAAEAEAVCRRGLALAPQDTALTVWLAYSLIGQQNPAAAGSVLHALQLRLPDHPEVLKAQGAYYSQLGMTGLAVSYLRTALAKNPQDAQAQQWLAQCQHGAAIVVAA